MRRPSARRRAEDLKMYFMSVIVPVFNVEKYLGRCLESLAGQPGFDKAEVILIDDGSTDSSGAVCDEYSSRYENVITIHKSNGGLSDARNTGIANAHGRYLAFLDPDDLVSDTFINDMHGLTEKYKPQMICFGYVFEKTPGKYAFTGDKTVSKSSPDKDLPEYVISKRTRDELLDDLLKLKIGNQICFNIYSAELFEGISFPVGRAYEDIATLYRLILRAENIIKVDRSYYVYNVSNAGSITKNTTMKNMSDMCNAVYVQCNAISEYFDIHGMDHEYLDYYKLNELIYIYIKVKREIAPDAESRAFLEELEREIDKTGRINILKYRHYSLKKYFYYKVTHLFRGKGAESKNGTDR